MPAPPPYSGDDPAIPRELRDYLIACVRAARPSRSRVDALRLLDALDAHEEVWEVPPVEVDWDEIEAEAQRQGCTVADVLYDRAGRRRDAA